MNKVFLATPAYGGQVKLAYHISIIASLTAGDDLTLYPMTGDALISRARNICAHQFLKSDCTHLLFVDADISFPPDAIAALLAADKDVVAAVYSKKKPGGEMVMNLPPGNEHDVVNGCIEALEVPTGFMLIRRSVFERMADEFPELLYVNDGEAHVGGGEPCFGFFNPLIADNRYLSEDYAFCHRWRSIGGKVFAHIGIPLGHVGDFTYRCAHHEPKFSHETEWCDVEANPTGIVERRHIERYEWAAERLRGLPIKLVANAACGTNYGAPILKRAGLSSIGIDRDETALKRSPKDCGYVRENLEGLSLVGFDALVCLETLERLNDPKGFLARLAPSVGELILSVPIIPTKHKNHWHKHDFTSAEIFTLLNEIGWNTLAMAQQSDDTLLVHARRR